MAAHQALFVHPAVHPAFTVAPSDLMEYLDAHWLTFAVGVAIMAVFMLVGNRKTMSYPVWLCWLTVPNVVLHQLEEHGVDYEGNRFQFMNAFNGPMTDLIGCPDDGSICPLDPRLIAQINLVNILFCFCASCTVMSDKNVLPGMIPVAISLFNCVGHMVQSAKSGEYNSGVLHSVVLQLPISLFICLQMYRKGYLSFLAAFPLTMFNGLVYHALFVVVSLKLRWVVGWSQEAVGGYAFGGVCVYILVWYIIGALTGAGAPASSASKKRD